MTNVKYFLWGGLSWAFNNPIGKIIGVDLNRHEGEKSATQSDSISSTQTQSGDFMVSLLVLFASVIKEDRKFTNTEEEYLKNFLSPQFNTMEIVGFIFLFKEILNQNYQTETVCSQIRKSMDHPGRLELIHSLFQLSKMDGLVHPIEVKNIGRIAQELNINDKDYGTIKAMFIKTTTSPYTILQVQSWARDADVKSAYRLLANKYHSRMLDYLGNKIQKSAEHKSKAIHDAYQTIKKERGWLL